MLRARTSATRPLHWLCLLQRRRASVLRAQYVLAKKGPLGKIWLAAHMEKKVPKLQIIATNIPESVDNIENPSIPMALRVSGHLLLGVVRIFSRKVNYLLTDCNEALVKIKDAFRAPGTVELPQGATTRRFDDITNPDHFDEMDLDADFAEPMSFSLVGDDDALVGISIPEAGFGDLGAEEPTSFGASQAFGEPEEGFGANENFEVFFGQGDEQVRTTRRPSAKPARRLWRSPPLRGANPAQPVRRVRAAGAHGRNALPRGSPPPPSPPSPLPSPPLPFSHTLTHTLWATSNRQPCRCLPGAVAFGGGGR